MSIHHKIIYGLLITFFSECCLAEHYTHEIDEEGNELEFYSSWQSRYVTEGRDNLNGASLQVSHLELEHDIFKLDVWNGWGYDAHYDELNIIPAIEFKTDEFKFYINYNRKQFYPRNFDNEIGAGFIYKGLPYNLYAGFDWYHSFTSDGSFFEMVLSKDISPKQYLTFTPSIILGINENYIPDGHDGLNHLGLQLEGEYELLRYLGLFTRLHYNVAIDADSNQYTGDTLLYNFLWGEIGIEIPFY